MRAIAKQYARRYREAKRSEKRQVAEEVKEKISWILTDELDVIGVLFLIRQPSGGGYRLASDEEILKKVMHLLRDLAMHE